MLPEFPQARDFISGQLRKFLKQRMWMRTGILQRMNKHILPEGNDSELVRADGSVDRKGKFRTRTPFQLKRADLEKEGAKAVLDALDKTAREMAMSVRESFFQRFEEIVKETGNTRSLHGQPFSLKAYLDMLEMIPIDFDPQGRPQLPDVEPVGTMMTLMQSEVTHEDQNRFQRILESKYVDWRDRESSRKLVD